MPVKSPPNAALVNKLVVIVGPTASGKTSLAIKLAKKYQGEIICADSRTIYRYMDVGTAKPTIDEQKSVKHHLIDIVDPNEQYSVVKFKTNCQKIIKDIQLRGKVPFLVGGTGLYIDSVLFDYRFRTHKQLVDVSKMSDDEVIQKAQELYPGEVAKIGVKNVRRIIGLLQFGPASTVDRNTIKIECKIIGIGKNRLILKQNIQSRTKQILSKGLVRETEKILKNFGPDCMGLDTIGYKQALDYLSGKITYSELEQAINKATFELAKRQITWFKRNPAIVWLENVQEAEKNVENYLLSK